MIYHIQTKSGDRFVWRGKLPAPVDGVITLNVTPMLLSCPDGSVVPLANVAALTPMDDD